MNKTHWVICFTGHRNKMTKNTALYEIYKQAQNTKWIHGGADGFDTQVQKFIEYHEIPFEIFEPEYDKFPNNPKYAPLARNYVMVDLCDFVVACYDGRREGGTYRTIKYANEIGRPVKYVPAYPFRKGQSTII